MSNRFESFAATSPEDESPVIEDIEQEVDERLRELPEELADRFEDAHRHISSAERREALNQLLAKREKALYERSGNDRDPEHVAVVETSPLALLNMIENIEKGPHENLGAGKAGRVIASTRYPNVCYKVMFAPDRIPSGTNDIGTEADLQDEVATLGEIKGVRAPKVFSFIHEDEMRAITMERLDAVSMRDVIDRKEALPEDFDPQIFMDKLEIYMLELNARGYYHRDLHEGNVMIDRKDATPYVIDFGYAKYTPFPEAAYELKVVEDGHMVDIVLPSDSASLGRLRKKAWLLAEGQHRSTE